MSTFLALSAIHMNWAIGTIVAMVVMQLPVFVWLWWLERYEKNR